MTLRGLRFRMAGVFTLCLLVSPGCGPAAELAELDLPTDRPLRAGFLLVNGVYNTELMAPWDVLQHTRYHSAPHPGIEVFTVAATTETGNHRRGSAHRP